MKHLHNIQRGNFRLLWAMPTLPAKTGAFPVRRSPQEIA
jgi:hypothetical protein